MRAIPFGPRFTLLAALLPAVALTASCAVKRDDPAPGEPTTDEDTGNSSEITVPPDEDTGEPPGDDTAAPPDDTGTVDDTGTTDTAPPPLTYPAAPYGKTVGQTLPNLKFKGYRDGVAPWTDIAMADYYDPAGSKTIRAVKIEMAAQW